MAYSELVKNFKKIRDYMRDFYVYGFKSRDEYTSKSARTYDDERRRLESWLGDYMQFRQTDEGKNVFISIDSRLTHHNPLYKAWKTKSFTDGDITLHFVLMDILVSAEQPLTLSEITEQIDEYLSVFKKPRMYDESTVRKKLKEYIAVGIINSTKQGKTMRYKRTGELPGMDVDILDYFSEAVPCGVIGSFLLDKLEGHDRLDEHFAFKHHYITGTLDSEILCSIFIAMREKRNITLETINRQKDRITENHVVPIQVMISAQSGRQYLMAYVPRFKRITSFRTDHIVDVKIDDVSERFDELRNIFANMRKNMWGVSTQSRSKDRMEYVEFTVRYTTEEGHIPKRLEREKRCGKVEYLDSGLCKFSAEVFDASELIPWIRTFICRIEEIHFSNMELENQFKDDIKEMYKMYGLEGDERDAV